jgi:hypothetical protein
MWETAYGFILDCSRGRNAPPYPLYRVTKAKNLPHFGGYI